MFQCGERRWKLIVLITSFEVNNFFVNLSQVKKSVLYSTDHFEKGNSQNHNIEVNTIRWFECPITSSSTGLDNSVTGHPVNHKLIM